MYKPKVDPCIFLHAEPGDWTLLLGEEMVDELLRRFGHLVHDVSELVSFALENPEAFHLGLRGLSVGGRFKEEWLLYVESGYVEPRWRARWPPLAQGGYIDVRLQVSPCFLLTVLDKRRMYIWRYRASSIFHWVTTVPRRRPLEVFRRAFPPWLRELGREKGYVWVAWSKWRDRYHRHLAEWLYWLDTGRMAHIDLMLGRTGPLCGSPGCAKKGGAELLYESS
ncbi:hypothetical protein [Pyrobaculum sp.]|uniref:hypothetical protein n=1 Tax=Pyrobaculum sp. TaxID=2004705 RepID=UPI003170DFDD